MPPELHDVKSWLIKAEHGRQTAQAALAHQPPITDTAAFHCQPAIEKMLKAYLVVRHMPFEKIHDLQALLRQCAQQDSTFEKLFDRVEPLSAYAVRFRYPGPADPTIEQVKKALTVVEEVRDFVMRLLPPEVAP